MAVLPGGLIIAVTFSKPEDSRGHGFLLEGLEPTGTRPCRVGRPRLSGASSGSSGLGGAPEAAVLSQGP